MRPHVLKGVLHCLRGAVYAADKVKWAQQLLSSLNPFAQPAAQAIGGSHLGGGPELKLCPEPPDILHVADHEGGAAQENDVDRVKHPLKLLFFSMCALLILSLLRHAWVVHPHILHLWTLQEHVTDRLLLNSCRIRLPRRLPPVRHRSKVIAVLVSDCHSQVKRFLYEPVGVVRLQLLKAGKRCCVCRFAFAQLVSDQKEKACPAPFCVLFDGCYLQLARPRDRQLLPCRF
mmetsp:Transcript_19277/g.43123  ORF Transcript_19277/g.43123 Transcript_19277/m.43123 type:complete len:231 (-) Transcript_19277:338-1030(-)